MFGSAQAFIGFLAGLIPLPVANASVNIASPTTTVCDAPLGMMIPMGANSCSDIPIMPNAAVVGFSNVLTGMSIGDFLGQLAWNAIKGAATMGFQGAIKKGANATARAIAKSNNPRLQNAAQRVNNFVGGDNCIAEGHPVDVVSGTMFSRQTDVQTFGAQAFTFDRFYNSRTVAPEGHLPADPAKTSAPAGATASTNGSSPMRPPMASAPSPTATTKAESSASTCPSPTATKTSTRSTASPCIASTAAPTRSDRSMAPSAALSSRARLPAK
jgi:hypothetical protein